MSERKETGEIPSCGGFSRVYCQDLGNDICAYSEKELTEKLEKQGGIKYYVKQGEGNGISHIGITSCRGRGPVSLRFGEPYGRLWDRRTS